MAGADELSNFSQFYVLEMPSNHSGQSAGKKNDAKHQKYMSINQSRDHGDLLARVIRHHTHLTFKKEENPLSFSA
ncbi:hypothetical protein D5086_008424 [Populus alba]|uniref:Uncharacterized protein n=1 Tax=Populus alba TaxID=43335 RepID=A0ACC4CH41_POPAL